MKVKKRFLATVLAIALCGLIFTVSAYGTSTIWSWMKDMYNQPSIKPQEEGSFKHFPIGSVTTEGLQISSDGEKHLKATDFTWIAARNSVALAPKNPQKATAESLKQGEFFFNSYCIACHGADGKSTTPVALFRGGVIPLDLILTDPTITDGYLFYKITYGGFGDVAMPPFGYSITEKERWHIVNYITHRWQNK